jgi:hypothetical protein
MYFYMYNIVLVIYIFPQKCATFENSICVDVLTEIGTC